MLVLEARKLGGIGQHHMEDYLAHADYLMTAQFSPHSPVASHLSLMFTPQAHMLSVQSLDEMHNPSHVWMKSSTEHEGMLCEQGLPTMITWSYGGKDVAVEGSWDNWKTKFRRLLRFIFPNLALDMLSLQNMLQHENTGPFRKLLQRSGKDFVIMKDFQQVSTSINLLLMDNGGVSLTSLGP